jgi:hypothetical protein
MYLKKANKYSTILLGFVISLFFVSCTGVNLRSWPYQMSPNTHPIKSYSDGSVIFKGGFFYHSDSSVLFSGSAKLEKKGTSCSHSVGYLIAFGSSRIYDAKVAGGVDKIGMIEEDVLAFLGGYLYHRHCTIVVGE